jgi:hypothetical protein
MKIPCTINGQPGEIEIPEEALAQGALSRKGAMKYLSVGSTTLNTLRSMDKIRVTSYGTYPLASLNEHLRQEIERGKKGKK